MVPLVELSYGFGLQGFLSISTLTVSPNRDFAPSFSRCLHNYIDPISTRQRNVLLPLPYSYSVYVVSMNTIQLHGNIGSGLER